MTTNIAPVSAIADVLALIGKDGWLTPPLQPIIACAVPTRSYAKTFRLEMSDNGPGLTALYAALSTDLIGCAIVIEACSVEGAIWGEILATAAKSSGAVMTIVDGSVRDRGSILEIDLPLYAEREIVVGPAGKAHVAEVGCALTIGSVSICQDDVIVADLSGCVRIPFAIADDVLDAALAYARAEQETLDALHRGEPLTTAYLYKKRAVRQILEDPCWR